MRKPPPHQPFTSEAIRFSKTITQRRMTRKLMILSAEKKKKKENYREFLMYRGVKE